VVVVVVVVVALVVVVVELTVASTVGDSYTYYCIFYIV
jgi:hypothetical protein